MTVKSLIAAGLMALVAALAAALAPARAGTLDQVRDYGVLRCGVLDLGQGLSTINAEGRWVGFYPRLCRAVAAAVLGDPEAVEFVMTGAEARFDDLRNDHFDLLMEPTTWTLSRDADGLTFLPIYLYDGQSFLVFRPDGISGIDDLKGRRICVEEHATSSANLREVNAARQMGWTIQNYDTIQGAFTAFYDRQCDAVSTDALILASFNRLLAPDADAYAILPDRISKEPLSAAVREGDPQWADAVGWVIQALIAAEELGVNRDNLMAMGDSANPDIRRLLGLEGDLGARLGLDARWAERAIRAAGNYGELYADTLTRDLGIPRGQNDLWTRGGLLMAPPLR